MLTSILEKMDILTRKILGFPTKNDIEKIHHINEVREILRETRIRCCGYIPVYLHALVKTHDGREGTIIDARRTLYNQTEILIETSDLLLWYGVRDVDYLAIPEYEYMNDE